MTKPFNDLENSLVAPIDLKQSSDRNYPLVWNNITAADAKNPFARLLITDLCFLQKTYRCNYVEAYSFVHNMPLALFFTISTLIAFSRKILKQCHIIII